MSDVNRNITNIAIAAAMIAVQREYDDGVDPASTLLLIHKASEEALRTIPESVRTALATRGAKMGSA